MSGPSSKSQIIPLSEFKKASHGISREEFLQLFPSPVLLLETKQGDFGDPGFQTVSAKPNEVAPRLPEDRPPEHDDDGIPEDADTTDLDIQFRPLAPVGLPPAIPVGPVAEKHADIAKRLDQASSALFVCPLVKREVNKFASMITLGRAANNDVRIALPSVSKFHAYFTHVPRDNTWWIADANSSNGTFVNGEKLKADKGRTRLENGAAIRLGPDVVARFFDAPSFYNFLTV